LTEALPRPEYPRPQFRRPGWANLNGEWAFAFDDEDAGLARGWHRVAPEDLRSEGSPFDRRITVPLCYQSDLSGIGDASFHDVVWYARTFDSPPRADAGRLSLHFGAVDYRAAVWVNGAQVAAHEGGHLRAVLGRRHALLEGGGERARHASRGPVAGHRHPHLQSERRPPGPASSARPVRGLDRPGRMILDRFADDQSGQNEPPVQGVRSRGALEMEKERETKKDGRYVIFYSFEGECERESSES
jgi:hypothetical protein